MKIATLGNASVIHTQRWVEWFRARGHEVRLWSLERGPGEARAQPLPAPPLPGFMRYPLAVPALKRALDDFAPDVVDAHYVPNYGLIAALAGRHPLSVSAWGSDLLIAGPRDPLQRARARFVLSRADLVIADSNNLAEAARTLGAFPARVRAIPWGIDLDRFRDRGVREPGLLLSTRMHEPIYDLPSLIRGAAPVMAARPETRLVVTGDGSERARLVRLARECLPADRVTFAGRVSPDEMAGWLARSDVYLSASHSDSTSLSLLEAMAAGALPVVSDLEGNREWVRDGEGARCFRTGDVDGVTAALERVLANPAWAAAARKRNRDVVEARADVSANMARIESLFDALARGRGLPGGA